ncbi:electron transporter RnfD [Anaerocolumna jejuensis]|uniref:electron transporter RnfD n=1 Tax=Anaerocolumna jejuensis TaxID=259063 RepID=UPI003F7CC324
MLILPDNENLQYSGRIDFEDKKAPVFVYPCSYVKMKFSGNILKVIVENNHSFWNNYLGYILDGEQGKLLLKESGKETLEIPVKNKHEHELLIFKRQDGCHVFRFLGFELEDGSCLYRPNPKPVRRIEVYGDSVSAGEVSEAVEYEGKADPEHKGQYSNSWYSYSWMTARKLNAEIHNIAQGGIALLDHSGWFAPPDYIGMEKVYDKIEYNPDLGEVKQWDFSSYTPHVVIIAIGQNDSHPKDYMSEDPDGEKSRIWKEHYRKFVEDIRMIYPKSIIILTTTILIHSPGWDHAIEEVCQRFEDVNIHHFYYKRNGSGTPGHIRISEADEMSDELSAFIRSLGEEIWIS